MHLKLYKKPKSLMDFKTKHLTISKPAYCSKNYKSNSRVFFSLYGILNIYLKYAYK